MEDFACIERTFFLGLFLLINIVKNHSMVNPHIYYEMKMYATKQD